MHVIYEIIGTVFFVGKIKRYGPTIVAFISAIAVYFLFILKAEIVFPLFVVLLLWGILASNYFIHKTGSSDPQEVVIDEVAGYILAAIIYVLLTVKSFTLLDSIFMAAIFRAFDSVKLPPVRQIERLPKGLGVMFDDLVSGLYAGTFYFVVQWLNARLF